MSTTTSKSIVFSKRELSTLAADRRLSREQRTAIELLLSGRGTQAEAKVAGHALRLFGYQHTTTMEVH